ncbi:MAG: hypothetical protein K2P57_04390 [Burkholderiales bacterium]|nr:hypothetical protein [Burkholderiales bacterium]
MFYSEPLPEPEPPLDKLEVALILLLTLAWILFGLVGHEPWKPDEAYNFGLAYHMIQSGNWLTLHLPDETPFASPPLFYLTAACFGKIFSPLLALPDAMRLATGFYMGLALLFVALAGRMLYGNGRYAVLILAGSLGLLGHAHQLIADCALFAGCSIAVCGFALFSRKAVAGGLLAGTGIGMGFLSKGLISIAFFFPVLLLLPLLGWKRLRLAAFIGAMLAAMAPWTLIWPWLLHLRFPLLFDAWWNSSFDLSFGLAREAHRNPLFYLGVLPWFAWPTLPLAALALWNERSRLNDEKILLPLILFSVMFLVLSVSITTRELYAMPMLIPLSLLATSSIDNLKRSATSAFNWFGTLTFGMMAGLAWLFWIALMTGYPAAIAAKIHHYHPDFVPHFSFFSFALALAATCLWIVLVFRTEHNGKRSVINWASGIVMIWTILMTLWLPFLDSVKGYKEMFDSMRAALPKQYDCIAGRHLGQPQRAMLDYYLGIDTRKESCELMLIQTLSSNRQHPEGWQKIWEGARAGDRFERYRLYRRE